MAAEHIVAFVVEKIAGQLIQEAGSLSTVHNHIQWIEGELRRMQCFLRDAEKKQDGDERVRNWVADIGDVAYDTDDVIDTFILKVAQRRRKGFIMIKIRIGEITDSRSTYGIENIGGGREGACIAASRLKEKRRSFSHACEEDIVGLEEEIRMLESCVIHGDSATLCNFDHWNGRFRVKETLHDLGQKLMGLGKADLEKMNNQDLVETLSTFLEDKRYIIVLDDIWKCEVWDDLKLIFPDKNNGSRVMLTTRFKYVALHADPRSPPHELSLLNDEDGWVLLSKKVCLEWNSNTTLPPWSKELGKEMVKRCGGLPLAIVVLGGLLSRKDATFNEWLKVLQSVHWQLTQDPTQCAEILALSYCDLPYYLKSCFLYFGLFPEDFEISARRLILLWVAEGFVQPRGQEPLEDVAEDYLEELIGRSMVQVAKRKSNGRIKTCRVHDLLRELSISKAREDQFLDVIHGDVKVGSLIRARRLALHFGVPLLTENTLKCRSLLCFDLGDSISNELKKLKLLRVLDLEGVYMAQLDSAIGSLIHLRYLGLRETWLQKLPSSVCYLSNLQTLDLRSTLINPIPVAIWKMQHLRHLYFNELKEMVIKPPKDAALGNLQTLKVIYISQTSCVDHGLDKLTNLRELGLHGDLLLQEEAVSNWILMSKSLECLKLQGRTTFEDITNVSIPKLMTFSSHKHLYKLHLGGSIGQLLDVEDFPPNLTELSLKGSFLMEDPMLKLEKLPSLRVLKLKKSSYVGKELVCTNGGFPQLHFLKLSFLYTIETWKIEEGAMGNLRDLEIVECNRLKIVPRGLQPVTSLRDLKLGFMQHDFEMKVQERKGENWYRIQHVLPV
ncbi:hypothetical protein F0562_023541 [Nyssa sinensis]|uniref:NB-ARC domain-containing protein n=1 Tax=Nyssa sinensis TaxID=561372 RepID=A0A5J5BGL3_9ASTE|nr:hypothetical protein F0562_023541 [Nyssa sinensis]